MIFIVCNECGSALRVSGEFNEVDYLLGPRCDWYPNRYPCWEAECHSNSARFSENMDPMAMTALVVHDLNPKEAYIALMQMGLPPEQECGVLAVRKAFEDSAVKKIEAWFIRGTKRCVVEYIELEDGTRLYFGSATEGAVVYRISRPHSYAKEVLDECEAHTSARP